MSTDTTADETVSDIIFECPHCGKSLAIDEQGQGMMISCPDCQSTIQVPGIGAVGHGTTQVGQGEHDMLVGSGADVNERISQELELIQAAIDRLVDLLQPRS